MTVVGHGLAVYSDVTLNPCVSGASSIDSNLQAVKSSFQI